MVPICLYNSLYRHEPSDRGPLKKTWLMDLRRLCDNVIAARKNNMEPPKQNIITHMVSYYPLETKIEFL